MAREGLLCNGAIVFDSSCKFCGSRYDYAKWSRNSTQIFVFLDRVIPYQPSMIKVAQIQTTFVVVSHEQRCTPNVIEKTGNIFYIILWEELSVNSKSSNTYQCNIIANVHFIICTVYIDFLFVIFVLMRFITNLS